jgi:hypothetical protein
MTIYPFMPLLLFHVGIQSNSSYQHFSRQIHQTKGIEKRERERERGENNGKLESMVGCGLMILSREI